MFSELLSEQLLLCLLLLLSSSLLFLILLLFLEGLVELDLQLCIGVGE